VSESAGFSCYNGITQLPDSGCTGYPRGLPGLGEKDCPWAQFPAPRQPRLGASKQHRSAAACRCHGQSTALVSLSPTIASASTLPGLPASRRLWLKCNTYRSKAVRRGCPLVQGYVKHGHVAARPACTLPLHPASAPAVGSA